MAVDIATLGIKVDSSDVRRADKDLDNLRKSGKGAEASTKGVSSAFNSMRGVLTGLGIGVLAKEFLDLTDASKKIEAQLKLATREFGNFGQAQKDARNIAAETRNGLEVTAELYGKFIRNSAALGKSQADAAQATETFSKALKISGASTSEAENVTRQFGQALASGVLRGDEFNSMMENGPRLAKLLADSLDTNVGALRAMAAEGELTSEKLYKALTDRKFTEGIDAEFSQLPVTFGEAMQKVYDSAIITFGAFDRGGEFSTMLSNFIVGGSQGFGDLEDKAEEFGINTRATIEGLASALNPLYDAVGSFFDFFEGQAAKSGINIKRDIQKSLDDLDRLSGWLSQQGLGGALVTGNSVGDWWNGTATGSNMGGRNRAAAEASARQGRAEMQGRKLDATFNTGSGQGFSFGGVDFGGGRAQPARASAAIDPKAAKEAEREAKKAAKEAERYAEETAKIIENALTTAYAGVAEQIADYNKEVARSSELAKDILADYEFESKLLKMNAQEREIAIASRELENKGIKEGTIAYSLYGEAILKAAGAKGQSLLDVENAREYTDAMADLNDTLQDVANSFGDIFGRAGEGFANLISEVGHYGEEQARLREIIADSSRTEAERARANAKVASNELAHYGNLLGAAKGFFKEKSTGYKVLQAAETAYRVFQFAMSVKSIVLGTAETAASVAQSGVKAAASTAAGAAKMFETLGPFGFAAVGAMLGLLGALSVGGSRGGGGASAAMTGMDNPNDLSRAKASPGVSVGTPTPANDIAMPGRVSNGSRMNQSIQITNLAPGVEIVADSMSEERITFIARKIVREDGPNVIAQDMRDPNSRTSKAVKNNFEVTARR